MRTPTMIGHLDADCFYVSAERVRFAELRGVSVGVLGNQGACVIAKSYEMKSKGVKTGMPIWEAVKLCPEGAYVKRDFRWYEVLSRSMLDIVKEFSYEVELAVRSKFSEFSDYRVCIGQSSAHPILSRPHPLMARLSLRPVLQPSPHSPRPCDTPLPGQSPRRFVRVDLPFSPHKTACSCVEFSAEPLPQPLLAFTAFAFGMIDRLLKTIRIERIDDLPLLLAQLRGMQVIPLLDQHFPTHGNWAGELTLGEVVAVWLAAIVSTGDHRLNQLQGWAADRLEMLAAGLGKPVRPEDFHDDRLADILDVLYQPTVWAAFEQELNAGLVRVYKLPTQTVRVDTTTASTYAAKDDAEGGLFQFGHSKDQRPDLAQIKVPIAALDPLGMPLVSTVVAGNTADDPLYVPTIAQVQQNFRGSGRLFVGDCKMAAVETRGYLASTGDYYLCPLSAVQVPKTVWPRLLQPVWEGTQPLTTVYRPVVDPAEVPEEVARGFEYTVTETTTIAGQTLSWTERRLVVCSLGQARRQGAALDQRVQRAAAELDGWNQRKRGKKHLTARPLSVEARS